MFNFEKYISVKYVFAFICILLSAVTVFQIINVTVMTDTDAYGGSEAFSSEIEKFQDAAYTEDNFKENQGMISLVCTGLNGGRVYVYINNTMKANIMNSDPKNLKVKKGDVIIVKGHGLTDEAEITVNAVLGNISSELTGKTVKVGNLGKRFFTV